MYNGVQQEWGHIGMGSHRGRVTQGWGHTRHTLHTSVPGPWEQTWVDPDPERPTPAMHTDHCNICYCSRQNKHTPILECTQTTVMLLFKTNTCQSWNTHKTLMLKHKETQHMPMPGTQTSVMLLLKTKHTPILEYTWNIDVKHKGTPETNFWNIHQPLWHYMWTKQMLKKWMTDSKHTISTRKICVG